MSIAGAGWTDERVERLKTLWAEGLSASQIAAELGGISRNAVIGKVHRLKLSGRAPRSESASRSKKTSVPRSTVARPAAITAPLARGNLAVALAPASLRHSDPEPKVATADVVPMARYLTLLELDACSCRWPIGDPRSPDFRFCGAPTQPGETYCGPCSRKAFQPRESRARRPAQGLQMDRLRRFG